MRIKYLKSFEKDLRKVTDKKVKLKLKNNILEMKEAQRLDDIKSVKKLVGHPNAFRIRIGDYRLGFYFEKDAIILARFVKRNDIYKLFP